jgi:hypothetical protein
VDQRKWDFYLVFETHKCRARPQDVHVDTIGRMHSSFPTDGDRFYLRMLLQKRPGIGSCREMRTVVNVDGDPVVYNTFKETCPALNLLRTDDEWKFVLQEAAAYQSPDKLRLLFVIILENNEVSNAVEIFTF